MNIKAFVHDKQIVFLAVILMLMTLFAVLMVLLRVDTTQSVAIIRNNTTLGLAGYEKADTTALYQFALIAVLIALSNLALAVRFHQLKRKVAILALALGSIAQLFLIVVATLILGLHR